MGMSKKDVEESPASRGRTYLLKYMKGEKLAASQAILAKCFDCMGGHIDGRIDCEMEDCSCYPWMPYKKKENKVPRKKKVLTKEHLANMKKGRDKKNVSKKTS